MLDTSQKGDGEGWRNEVLVSSEETVGPVDGRTYPPFAHVPWDIDEADCTGGRLKFGTLEFDFVSTNVKGRITGQPEMPLAIFKVAYSCNPFTCVMAYSCNPYGESLLQLQANTCCIIQALRPRARPGEGPSAEHRPEEEEAAGQADSEAGQVCTLSLNTTANQPFHPAF